VRNAESFGRERGQQCGPVSHREDGIKRPTSREYAARCVWIFEAHRNGPIAPWIIEHVTTIGSQHEIETQPARCIIEDARLIAGCGGH